MAVSTRSIALPERVSFARIPDIRTMPGLIQIQHDSFEWFKQEGLRELFEEISPIEDFTGKNLSLEFIVPPDPFGKPKYSEDECRDRRDVGRMLFAQPGTLHDCARGRPSANRWTQGHPAAADWARTVPRALADRSLV